MYLNSLNLELGKQLSGFEPRAIEMLRQYPWPNNYTQFKNLLRSLATLTNGPYIRSSSVADLLSKERSLRSAMEYALETDGIDGVVLDPWTSSATLDVSLLSGLLKSERGSDNPGAQELEAGHAAARAGDWP